MISYIEDVLGKFRSRYEEADNDTADKEELRASIESMQANLDKLKPVIDAHNKEFNDLQTRDAEMDKLIHEFKNSLLIEKIKMDTWENKTGK
jgi:uncharacterized protein YlxW (UPF0749 family)